MENPAASAAFANAPPVNGQYVCISFFSIHICLDVFPFLPIYICQNSQYIFPLTVSIGSPDAASVAFANVQQCWDTLL